jgi:hypothetical protein
MSNNLKTINLFWIIFMGRVEDGGGMEATLQAVSLKPAATDAAKLNKAARHGPGTKKRKQRKKS